MTEPDWVETFLDGHRDELVAFRRRLHAHPEVSRNEHHTTEAIVERLNAAGLRPRVVSTGTGVICDIGAGDRTVALRADIDGLAMHDLKDVSYRSKVDGVAHGCGHDLHTTIVLGAGLALAEHVDQGRIRLIFEPAEEEVPGGAVDVIADGGMDGVDAIFGFHADPKIDVGTVGVRAGALTASADLVQINLFGPGGHTARPQLTVDLVAWAGRVAADLPVRVAEAAAELGSLSLVFGAIRAGDAANVIPTIAELRGSLRSPDPVAHAQAERIIEHELTALLDGSGATHELTYRHGVPPVVNDQALAEVMRDAVRGTVGAGALVEPPRSAGGDTFAWYLERAPGCYARLGVADPSQPERLELHSGAFDVHEDAIDVGVRVLIAAALGALDGNGLPPSPGIATFSAFSATHELVAELAARRISSREVLAGLVERAERLNPELNAIVTFDLERAEALAAAADEATARGEWWGPLHGVPMTVKDVWETQDLLTTSGAPELADHLPGTDAIAVARLKAAGAVIYGKTNTPLYAGDLQTYNELFGVTRNPWALDRTTGGSSGGSAAAVAAGLTPLELGSDIGGSIRMPSHFCGVYGLKPTWGVVPSRGHVPGPPGSLNETDVNSGGPIARNLIDLALGFGVLSGPTPEQAVGWTLSLPPAVTRDGVRGLRVAFCDDDPALPASAEVRAVLGRVADALSDAGAFVIRQQLPVSLFDSMRSWQDLVLPITGSGLPDALFQAFASADEAPYEADLLSRSASSLVERHRSWLRAHGRRLHQERRWAAHFDQFDVTIAPVMPGVAFPHDVDRPLHERTVELDGHTVNHIELIAWCAGIGVMRLPVVAMPAGLGSSGLPVGLQVVGAAFHDLDVLAISLAIDRVLSDVGAGVGAPPGFGPAD